MKALLDTNIIIHREAARVVNQDIGILYKWLDNINYQKCIHPLSVDEINKNPNKSTVDSFNIKIKSYNILKTVAALSPEVLAVSDKHDNNENDKIDTRLLNELYNDRVDLLITEDKKIRLKAALLGISERVFTINLFLEKIYREYPDLIDYKVLSVNKKLFGELSLSDPFFETLKEDYIGFDKWFNRKSDELAYVTVNKSNGLILSFLYIKSEDENEFYHGFNPSFEKKKRLKVGTFKVISNGVKLGERFLKIIFDNAVKQSVDEIYVTIFEKRTEQKRLIELLEEWGFCFYGYKGNAGELVYVRDFKKNFNIQAPKKTYPFYSINTKIFLVPIQPDYHTELIPDSILNNESKDSFLDDEPHRNSIAKVYISKSWERNVKKGDVIVFYRTGGYHLSVVTTIAIVDEVWQTFSSYDDFLNKCKKLSVFSDSQIKNYWSEDEKKPFLVKFLYVYSLPKRPNLKRLIELGVVADVKSAPRGFLKITKEQFYKIIKDTESDESIIVD